MRTCAYNILAQSLSVPHDMCVLFASARYLAHYSIWGVVSALSAEYDGLPFGTIQSFADGPLDNSTGVPYFYISPLSDTYKNIQRSASVSLTLTEASGEYCRSQGTWCTVSSFSASCFWCFIGSMRIMRSCMLCIVLHVFGIYRIIILKTLRH